MRVVYATAAWSPHDARFLRAIVRQQHQVWFSCARWTASSFPHQLPDGVALWPVAQSETAQWSRYLQAHAVDVIHAGPVPTVAATLAEGDLPVPLVAMSWGSDLLVDAVDSPELRARACVALARADVVMADCVAVVEQVSRLCPRTKAPRIVFPWGLELDRFRLLPTAESFSLRGSLNWHDHVVLISTRSWEPGYGIDVLLKAFAAAAKREERLRLVLISDGSLATEVAEQLVELNIESRVHCPGRIAESMLPAWLCAADLYVSSSLSDGTSISLLEAMACKLPVVANGAHGNKEWVVEDETGWLTDCGNAEKLAETICCAIAKSGNWASMGREARRLAFARANWDTNSAKISEAYRLANKRYRT